MAFDSSKIESHDGADEGAEPAPPRVRQLSEADRRRQRLRSFAIAWALFALAVMFFLVTIVRLGGNVANRPF